MGKSAKTSNQAVAGIHSTATTKPTTSSSTKTTSTKSTSSGSSKSYSSGSGGTSGAAAVTTPSIGEQLYSTYGSGVSNSNLYNQAAAAAAAQQIVNNAKANLPTVSVEKLNHVDITDQKNQLADLTEQQKQQALNQIDYATQTGVNQLQRAYEDALPQYQTQRDQIAIEAAKALDNQALYASQRGDNGGIGKAQYGEIQNSAMTNTRAVNTAQIQLYTDTSRQVADLQAQGEFDKADKVLSISQEYTEKLMELEQWAKEQNIGIDEFNSKLDQWKADYDLSVSKYLTDTELKASEEAGAFPSGAATASMATDTADRYATSGKAMLSAGVIPSDEQLSAMGWTPEQYWVYKMSNASASGAG